MSNETDSYLSPEDIELIEKISRTNLGETEKSAVINDIRADAWRRSQAGTFSKPQEKFDLSRVSNLSSTPKQKPDGWDESTARVKAQLEHSRTYAPTEGRNNSPFYAAEQREEAERKRVEAWKQRKEAEIALTNENRIKREIAEYERAGTLAAKKEAMQRLSPEALGRIASKGAAMRSNLDDGEGFEDKVR